MTRGNSTSVPAKLSENAQCSAQQRLGRGEGGKGVSQSVGERGHQVIVPHLVPGAL